MRNCLFMRYFLISIEDLAKNEYRKIKKKLEKKYQGQELEYRIRQKMFQKGFSYEGSKLD